MATFEGNETFPGDITMSVFDHKIATLEGEPDALGSLRGQTVLVVNVASKCGLTPQYEGLVKLHDEFHDQGFSVLGVPCNQFLGQEPGSADEIREFCSTTYGVDFPLAEKVEVNGENRHPLYEELTAVADDEGHTGDIRWNFEKFLVDADGNIVARFAPQVEPEDGRIVEAVKRSLPQDG